MSDFDCSDAEEYSYSNDRILDPKRHARTQHNELERRRRNNIKDMYNALKDSIPGMKNERASRAVILKKAVELITSKKKNLDLGLSEIKNLENEYLELQKELATLESTSETSETTVNNYRIVSCF
uniref:BHLH domain-containing protein n=1 Tax=Syphacia muris TaxID=451379 RepID=A0A0N5B132_9BILA